MIAAGRTRRRKVGSRVTSAIEPGSDAASLERSEESLVVGRASVAIVHAAVHVTDGVDDRGQGHATGVLDRGRARSTRDAATDRAVEIATADGEFKFPNTSKDPALLSMHFVKSI